MRFFFLFVFLLFFATTIKAQKSHIDSLKSKLKSTKTEIEKMEVLNQLAHSLLIDYPKEAQKYAEEAQKIAELANHTQGLQTSKQNIALAEQLVQKQNNFAYILSIGILLVLVLLYFTLTSKQNKATTTEEQVAQLREELEKNKTLLEDKEHSLDLKKRETNVVYHELENKIREQNLSLQSAAESLLQRNKDLEEFSYIVSHDLRAPVANMLGLTALFRNPAMPAEQYKDLVPYLEESARRLDTTIRDLNEVLSIRNNAMKNRENVNIATSLDFIKKSLKMEIAESQIEVFNDFSQLAEIYTVKSYLESILYNLLSNAIKFRSPNRNPQVRLQTIEGKDFDCLIVSDNGLGIDLRSGTYKIFGLYQRMHTHTEGKGFGLYLVQTQVEALNGKIEVESQIGQGTTFKVYFKK